MNSPAVKLISLDAATSFPASGQSFVRDFGVVDPGMDFDEAIVSWNVDSAATAGLSVRVSAVQDGVETKSFDLGEWTYDVHLRPRASVDKQGDASGTVLTDTLRLKVPAQKLKLSVVMDNLGPGEIPQLKLLTVCFSNSKAPGSFVLSAGSSPAWGMDISVPQRAQGSYPNGGVLCSATTVSMLLSHYSETLNRPELNQDVPAVEQGVWDTVYKGAGNWPFNMAYAGSFSGMRGYVARFNGISDLEKWVAAGVPVGISVSFDMLRGKPLSPTESGHLIVLTGFTPTGDPIVNDPAFKDGVHKTYPRADFEKAWVYSKRTVYLVYPDSVKVPANDDLLWIGG